MTEPKYELSELDHIYFSLFGSYPTKEGQSYERLVGAALKIIYPDKKIKLDERKRGVYDKNLYQIDASLYSMDSSVMVEAKDHTKFKSKVSRPELDKVAGSLIELDFQTGLFFSATDYTRDARKKAKGSEINPNAKKISLIHLRKSKTEDDIGRLKKIEIDITTFEIDEQKTRFEPSLPKAFFDQLTLQNIPTELKSATSFYYDETSVQVTGQLYSKNIYQGEYSFFKTLDKSIYQNVKGDNLTIEGEWVVDSSHIKLGELNSTIDKVNYKITFKEVVLAQVEVKSKGSPVLLIAAEDRSINKLITDNQLKGISFNEDGEVTFDGSLP